MFSDACWGPGRAKDGIIPFLRCPLQRPLMTGHRSDNCGQLRGVHMSSSAAGMPNGSLLSWCLPGWGECGGLVDRRDDQPGDRVRVTPDVDGAGLEPALGRGPCGGTPAYPLLPYTLLWFATQNSTTRLHGIGGRPAPKNLGVAQPSALSSGDDGPYSARTGGVTIVPA